MLEDLPTSTCTWEVWLVNRIDMPSYLSEYFITVTNRNCMQLLHSNPGGLTQRTVSFQSRDIQGHVNFANIFSRPQSCFNKSWQMYHIPETCFVWHGFGMVSRFYQNSKDLQKFSRTENYIPETCLTRQNEENRKIIYRKLELAWIVQSNPHLHLDHFYLSPT